MESTVADMLSINEAIESLRALTACCCTYPYPLASQRHDPHCRQDWAEDVELLATAAANVELTDDRLTDAARVARTAFHAPLRDPFPSDGRWIEVVRAVLTEVEGDRTVALGRRDIAIKVARFMRLNYTGGTTTVPWQDAPEDEREGWIEEASHIVDLVQGRERP